VEKNKQFVKLVMEELIKEFTTIGIDVPRVVSLKRPPRGRSKAKEPIQRIEDDLKRTEDTVNRLEEFIREVHNILVKIVKKNKKKLKESKKSEGQLLLEKINCESSLGVGCKGEDVMFLQQYLIARKFLLPQNEKGNSNADGIYGKRTAAAVTGLQKKLGQTPDGVFGEKTLTAWEKSPNIQGAERTPSIEGSDDLDAPPTDMPTPSRLRDKSPPSSLVKVPSAWGGGTRLEPTMAHVIEKLQADAKEAGFGGKLFLPSGPNSGYRPIDNQKKKWAAGMKKYGRKGESPKRKIVEKNGKYYVISKGSGKTIAKYNSREKAVAKLVNQYVARPGGSPHGSGRAIDFFLGVAPSSGNNNKIASTAAYAWLVKNAHKYGLYQYEDENWHWELNEEGRDWWAKKIGGDDDGRGVA